MAKKKAKSNPRKDQKKFSIGDYIKDSPQAVEADDYLSEICKTRETPGTSCLREPIHTRVPGIINAKKIADSYEKSVDRVFYKARELMKKGKVLQSWKDRARWVGYLFGVYIRNTPSTEIEKVASFMQDYGTFNYDEELKDDRWLIPITGSFYNDIRANWMAKQAQRMTPEESIDLAEEICRNIICQVRNSYINGFTSSFAVMPKLPDTMDAVEKYLKDFTDDSSRKVTPLLRSEDEKLLYWNYVAVMRFGLLHKQYRYTVFDCMPDMLTNSPFGYVTSVTKDRVDQLLKADEEGMFQFGVKFSRKTAFFNREIAEIRLAELQRIRDTCSPADFVDATDGAIVYYVI